MKKIRKFTLSLIGILLLTFTLVGCNKQFEHKPTTISFGNNILNISIENIKNYNNEDYMAPDIFSYAIDFEIKIKNSSPENATDVGIYKNDFEFYLNSPSIIFKTYIYTDNQNQEIEHITLQSQQTKTIHLKMIYYSEEKIKTANDYTIKLFRNRI